MQPPEGLQRSRDDSLLGCETARRLTGAGPEETGKRTHTGFRPGDGLVRGKVGTHFLLFLTSCG